jgi:microcystin-dependent protein
VTLTATQIGAHSHGLNLFAQNDPTKRSGAPTANSALSVPTGPTTTPFLPPGNADAQFNSAMVENATGAGQPHNNQQPYLAVNFCIALQGVFPPRS